MKLIVLIAGLSILTGCASRTDRPVLSDLRPGGYERQTRGCLATNPTERDVRLCAFLMEESRALHQRQVDQNQKMMLMVNNYMQSEAFAQYLSKVRREEELRANEIKSLRTQGYSVCETSPSGIKACK